MKAIRFHEFGDAGVLRLDDVPAPAIGPDEVLIELKAAALNHLDIFVRESSRQRDIPLPHIPGSDGSGIVTDIGRDVNTVKTGDRVLISPGLSCGRCRQCLDGRDNLCRSYRVLGTREDGTYAELVKVPAVNVLPIPGELNFNEAAAVPLVFLTAWHMLIGLAKLQPGETVLVHGAGSGVGSAAIQIAKLQGAHVITTAGSGEKLHRAKELGADELINYREKEFAEEVQRITGKRGVDVVFEHIGGNVFENSIPILGKGGRLVTCGSTDNFKVTLDLRYVFSRHQAIYGSWMGGKGELAQVLKYFAENPTGITLRPVIDTVMPLADASKAHRRMEARENFGKIVLAI